MTRNQRTTYDLRASFGVNRGRGWIDQPDAEHEIEEVEGLPLPAKVDPAASYSINRNEARR